MRRTAVAAVLGVLTAGLASAATTPGTVRVSVSSSGVEGRYASSLGVVSADGRFVAFDSQAGNLGRIRDTNGLQDVYMRDITRGTTQRVSFTWNGRAANGSSWVRAVSADGRYVLFGSDASNLTRRRTVSGHDYPVSGVYLRDVRSGTVRRMSVTSSGVQANDDSIALGMSAGGRYILFASRATNLGPACAHPVQSLYVRDRVAHRTRLVSLPCVDAGYAPAQSDVSDVAAAISPSGRYVAFSGPGLEGQRLFVRDRATGTLRGVPALPGHRLLPTAISADGRFITFTGYLTGHLLDYGFQAYRRDRLASRTALVSVSRSGAPGNGDSYTWSASADGRWVVLVSRATDLIAGDTNARPDAFVRDMLTGQTWRISLSVTGTQLAMGADDAGISADGRWLTFSSHDPHVVDGDTNRTGDVFLRGPLR